ncbi:MAG: AMP phosphorylase [Hadesarchaea archaeon]|nr:AMP phosphorylase [Hadesarchaea archaeon]
MTLKVKPLDMETGRNIVVLHEDDAEELGHFAGDRVTLATPKITIVAIANATRRMVQQGELGTFVEVTEALGLKLGDEVTVSLAPRPQSVAAIKKKMTGQQLSSEEIGAIIGDIVADNLTTTEMTAFVVAEYIKGMGTDEIVALTRHMVDTGDTLELDVKPVLDVHSIGGVPGNKYALIVVPIVAATGLTVPKTSSRAITSGAGTADVMEVLANVTLGLDEIKKIVTQVGAVLAWGGAVRLAPADDIIIRTERMLGVDPRCQLLASVMSKKLAVGADHILIDIPTGPGSKVEQIEEARDLARDFIELGHRLGVQVESAVTYGGQPVGYAVGPALEAKEALETLRGNGPGSLVEKATSLAGIMLELGGAAAPGLGRQTAMEILSSGKACQKMCEIIEAQGGDPKIKSEDIYIGEKKETLTAPQSGYVTHIYNQRINDIARAAGAPRDKGAGLRILMKEGRKVDKGEPCLEIYAEHETKLDEAIAIAKRYPPVKIEGMLLEKMSGRPRIG